MRVMVLVKATEDSEKTYRPSPETDAMMAAMGRFNDALRDAGILIMADGLTPSSQGKRIGFDGPDRTVIDGPDRTVIDGPFPDPRQLIAGFFATLAMTIQTNVIFL